VAPQCFSGTIDEVVDDPKNRFRAHRNYVDAFAWIGGLDRITDTPAALEQLAAVAARIDADKRPTEIDLAQVEKSLRHGWSTEVLLELPRQWAGDEDELLRLSNSWGVVQSYYVGYHLTQALIVAKGQPRPTSHTTTQRQFAAYWVGRTLALPPWTYGVSAEGLINLPAGTAIDESINPWKACNDLTAWSLAAKALTSTRDDAVTDALREKKVRLQADARKSWIREEQARLELGRNARKLPTFPRPRLSVAQRSECVAGVRTYTILDYLYRLRVSANYDDAAVFHEGPENSAESYFLQAKLSFLAAGIALCSEVRIRDLVGPTTFYRWADDFAKTSIGSGYDLGIKARRHLL
jgi:hypothetical protein